MSISSMGSNFLNGYIGGHGTLLTLKSLSNPEYIIKFKASTLHSKSINVDNEFGWDDVESDSSKLGYTIQKGEAPNTFRKQKFNPLNSTTHISLDGVVAPFMYFALDRLAMRMAQPFDTLKLLRVLGLQGVQFEAYGGAYSDTTGSIDNVIYYGRWVLKSLSWDESNFQYASNAAKIEFSAKFAVNLEYQQYEGKTIKVNDSTLNSYPIKKWS